MPVQTPLIDANTLYQLLYVDLATKEDVANLYQTSTFTIDQYLTKYQFDPPFDNVTPMFAYVHANAAYAKANAVASDPNVASSIYANTIIFGTANAAFNAANSAAANSGVISIFSRKGVVTMTANDVANSLSYVPFSTTPVGGVDMLVWSANVTGFGPPTLTTRSVGTRQVYWPSISGTNTDYAVGIDSETLWWSVPDTGAGYKWYKINSVVMSLSSGGLLTVSQGVSSTQFQSTVGAGFAPLIVASNTAVANLNADMVDGQHAIEFANTGFAQSAFNQANTANTEALAAFSQANTANVTAQAAFNKANTGVNLTGPITSVGVATAVGSQTGTGNTFVMNASPTLTGTTTANSTSAGAETTPLQIQNADSGSQNTAVSLGFFAHATAKTGTIKNQRVNQASSLYDMIFSTFNGSAVTEMMRITGTGILSLPKGQISFPATQNPSSDVNTLDDYEEGTWTPTDASGAGLTFTVNSATYVKIGRAVFFQCYIIFPATGSGLGIAIGGIPFTSSSIQTAPVYSSGTNAYTFVAQMTGSSFNIFSQAGAQQTNAQMSGAFMIITGMYNT